MSSIKFYYFPGACSLAPHILLHEIGVDFEAIRMKAPPTPGVLFGEEFRLINSKMRVPVISLGQDTITEIPAITTAISNLAPEMGLMGRTPMDTVRVYEWLNWASGTLHSGAFGHIFRPERYSDDPASHEGIKAKGIEHVKEYFDFIEDKLVDIYAVGGAFTAVDAFLFVCYRWANGGSGYVSMDKYPKYTALVSNLVQRPAVKATLKAEDIKSTL